MLLDKSELSKILDISDPFLMIDTLVTLEVGKFSYCTKLVSSSDWFIKAHLPLSGAVMPGTLLTECMLQATILILYLKDDFGKNPAYVNKINVKLFANVRLPEKLEIFSYIDSIRRGIVVGHSEIKAKEGVLCRGEFSYVCPHLLPKLPSKCN